MIPDGDRRGENQRAIKDRGRRPMNQGHSLVHRINLRSHQRNLFAVARANFLAVPVSSWNGKEKAR